MPSVTIYSDINVDSKMLESMLRTQGLLKETQKMNAHKNISIRVTEEKHYTPQVFSAEQKEKISKLSIPELGLSNHVLTLLGKAKITSLRELVAFPEIHLMKFRGISQKTVDKIQTALKKIDLSLQPVD